MSCGLCVLAEVSGDMRLSGSSNGGIRVLFAIWRFTWMTLPSLQISLKFVCRHSVLLTNSLALRTFQPTPTEKARFAITFLLAPVWPLALANSLRVDVCVSALFVQHGLRSVGLPASWWWIVTLVCRVIFLRQNSRKINGFFTEALCSDWKPFNQVDWIDRVKPKPAVVKWRNWIVKRSPCFIQRSSEGDDGANVSEYHPTRFEAIASNSIEMTIIAAIALFVPYASEITTRLSFTER